MLNSKAYAAKYLTLSGPLINANRRTSQEGLVYEIHTLRLT